MNNNYQKELDVAKGIAKKAGKIMLQYFDGDQQIETKADNSPVTIADKQINRLVIDELSKNFDDVVIGEEESTGDYGMGRRWLCDPIDGTNSFVWGVPTAMFSLALVVDGKPVLGVAYDPFLDRLYEAVHGHGAYCNGIQLHVSQKELAGEYLAATGSVKQILERPSHILKLIEHKVLLAAFNGAVYKSCLVARGKFVGYIEGQVNAHDMAAVHVIVEESGGKITDCDGKELDYSKPFKGAVVSNTIVHAKLVECLGDK